MTRRNMVGPWDTPVLTNTAGAHHPQWLSIIMDSAPVMKSKTTLSSKGGSDPLDDLLEVRSFLVNKPPAAGEH